MLLHQWCRCHYITSLFALHRGYNPDDYRHLAVSEEVRELFNYIGRYKPHNIELETKLKPFIPEYIPSIGEIDAFLKVSLAGRSCPLWVH